MLGEITGGGGYADLLPHSFEIVVFGVTCRILSLEKLIAVKRAAGRPKDFEVIAELEAILERQRRGGVRASLSSVRPERRPREARPESRDRAGIALES